MWDIKKYNPSYVIAVVVMLLLTLFSLIAYKQRMLFVDPCWVSFNIINTKTFSIAEHRYGAFVSQIFPLAGTYLGWSVKSILMIYSVSFYLFYLTTIVLAGFVWRQQWLGLLVALYFTILVSDVYYWPNNEVHQGVCWMVLFLAFYFRNQKLQRWGAIRHVCLIIFAGLAISSHLLVILPFSFLWLYAHLQGNLRLLWKDRVFIAYSILLLCLMAVRYWLSSQGWYDPNKLEAVQGMSWRSVIHAFSSGQSVTFLNSVWTNYWIFPPLVVLGMYLLLRQGKYLLSFLVMAYSLAYYILICVTFPQAYDRSLLFYMESEWLAFSIILLTPLIVELFKTKMSGKAIAILFLVVFGVRIAYIAKSFEYFDARYQLLDRVVDHLHNNQQWNTIIMEDQAVANQHFIMDWGLPVESMMLSKVKSYDRQVSFKIMRKDAVLYPILDSFYSCFNILPVSFMDSSYFQFNAGYPYKIVNGLDSFLNQSAIIRNESISP